MEYDCLDYTSNYYDRGLMWTRLSMLGNKIIKMVLKLSCVCRVSVVEQWRRRDVSVLEDQCLSVGG